MEIHGRRYSIIFLTAGLTVAVSMEIPSARADVIAVTFNHGSTYHYTGPLGPNPRNSVVSIDMVVSFTNPFGGGLKTRAGKTSTFKLPPVSPLSTRLVKDTNNPAATAQATATFIASEGTLLFSLHTGLMTSVTVPPGYKIEGYSYSSDPLSSEISGTGNVVTYTDTLLAGTVIPEQTSAFPDLAADVFGRYGIGDAFQADQPESLWGTPDDEALPIPAPAGAFDLFHIQIFDSPFGTLTAVASGANTTSPLSVAFSKSLSQIEALIEDTSNWTHLADGSWMLNTDLDLFDLTLTNTDPDLIGQNFTIGTFDRSNVGGSVPADEPSSLFLLGAGLALLLGKTSSSKDRVSGSPRKPGSTAKLLKLTLGRLP